MCVQILYANATLYAASQKYEAGFFTSRADLKEMEGVTFLEAQGSGANTCRCWNNKSGSLRAALLPLDKPFDKLKAGSGQAIPITNYALTITSFSNLSPILSLCTSRSYLACRFIQKLSELPK